MEAIKTAEIIEAETTENRAAQNEKIHNFPTKNGTNATPTSSRSIESLGGVLTSEKFTQAFPANAQYAKIDVCSVCYGSGMEVVKGKDGGARPCPQCRRPKMRVQLIAAIPPKIKRHGTPELKSFAPRQDLHPSAPVAKRIYDEQVKILAKIKNNPLGNFYLAGLNGCGKTTIAYALLLNAFDAGRQCVAVTLFDLLDQFQAYTISKGEDKQRNKPCILAETLQQDKRLYSILIDEVGSPKASEYRGEMFFNLLNAIQNFGHQLIVTSNKTDREFVEKWSAFDDTHGDSIARRLSENAAAMRCFL